MGNQTSDFQIRAIRSCIWTWSESELRTSRLPIGRTDVAICINPSEFRHPLSIYKSIQNHSVVKVQWGWKIPAFVFFWIWSVKTINFAFSIATLLINSGRVAMSGREISLMHMWALYESEMRSLGKRLQMLTLTRNVPTTEEFVKYNSGVKFFKKNVLVCQAILLPDACWGCIVIFYELNIRFETRCFWSIPLGFELFFQRSLLCPLSFGLWAGDFGLKQLN